MRHKTGKYIKCKICDKSFYIRYCQFNTKRFCSRKCYATFRKNKKRNPQVGKKISDALKGKKYTLERRQKLSELHKQLYKNGAYVPSRKGIPLSKSHKQKSINTLKPYWVNGEKNHNWKGSKITYSTLHKWLVKKYGNPKKCEHCGKIGKKTGRRWNLEWANINHLYKRSKNDFIGLCSACHKQHDIKLKKL
jgi:hypothetical protein